MKKIRILLLRRWYMVGGAALLAAAAVFYAVNYPAAVSTAATTRQLPIYSVERAQKVCAISFDAAWGEGKVRHGCCGKCAHLSGLSLPVVFCPPGLPSPLSGGWDSPVFLSIYMNPTYSSSASGEFSGKKRAGSIRSFAASLSMKESSRNLMSSIKLRSLISASSTRKKRRSPF